MRPRISEIAQRQSLPRRCGGSVLRFLLLFLALASVAAVALLFSLQARPGSGVSLPWRKEPPSANAQVSGMAENASQQWAVARIGMVKSLKEAAKAKSPADGLAHFLSLKPARDTTINDIETLAGLTLRKLAEKENEFADPHIQSLLPAEVLPELAQALSDHRRGIERIQNEARTLKTQTLPDMEEHMKKLVEACRLKEQLSGQEAARDLWQNSVTKLAAQLSGEQ